MSAKGIDCAKPLTADRARAIAGDGNVFVARYLVPERYAWKRLTRKEAEAISAAGMQIVSVFEASPGRPAGGAAAGTVDGVEAYREAQLIGQPTGTAIYFAVDYDAQPKDYDDIEQYLRAAAVEVPGYSIGVYGSYAVVKTMFERNAVKHIWQTYAWSRGKFTNRANIYQHKNDISAFGITLDLNTSYGGEGWWNTKGEELEMEELLKRIEAQEQRIAELEATASMPKPPEWACEAVAVAVAAGIVAEPNGHGEDFYAVITVLHRKGLL